MSAYATRKLDFDRLLARELVLIAQHAVDPEMDAHVPGRRLDVDVTGAPEHRVAKDVIGRPTIGASVAGSTSVTGAGSAWPAASKDASGRGT